MARPYPYANLASFLKLYAVQMIFHINLTFSKPLWRNAKYQNIPSLQKSAFVYGYFYSIYPLGTILTLFSIGIETIKIITSIFFCFFCFHKLPTRAGKSLYLSINLKFTIPWFDCFTCPYFTPWFPFTVGLSNPHSEASLKTSTAKNYYMGISSTAL